MHPLYHTLVKYFVDFIYIYVYSCLLVNESMYNCEIGVGGNGRRDSLERAAAAATTVFSPGTLDQYSRGKWPGASTGTIMGTAGAPLSPPLAPATGLPRTISAAPGAEAAKYRLVKLKYLSIDC